MARSLDLHLLAAPLSFGSCREGDAALGVWLWGRGITPGDLSRLGPVLREHLASAKAAQLIWLTGLPQAAPTDAVREQLTQMIARVPPNHVEIVYLIEASSFGSAIARSVVTGLDLKARPTIKVIQTELLDEAARELCRALGWADEAALASALQAARVAWAAAGGTPLP